MELIALGIVGIMGMIGIPAVLGAIVVMWSWQCRG